MNWKLVLWLFILEILVLTCHNFSCRHQNSAAKEFQRIRLSFCGQCNHPRPIAMFEILSINNSVTNVRRSNTTWFDILTSPSKISSMLTKGDFKLVQPTKCKKKKNLQEVDLTMEVFILTTNSLEDSLEHQVTSSKTSFKTCPSEFYNFIFRHIQSLLFLYRPKRRRHLIALNVQHNLTFHTKPLFGFALM